MNMKNFQWEKCVAKQNENIFFRKMFVSIWCLSSPLLLRERANMSSTARSIPGNVAVVIAMIMAIAKNRHNQLTVWTKALTKEQKKKLLWIEKQKSSTQNQPMWKEISRIWLKIKHAYFYFYIGIEMNKINGGEKKAWAKNKMKNAYRLWMWIWNTHVKHVTSLRRKATNERDRTTHTNSKSVRLRTRTHMT